VFLFLSCTASDQKSQQDERIFSNVIKSITSVAADNYPETLPASEYEDWVKKQNGVTYHSVSGEQFIIRLIFTPPQLEAYNSAVANGQNPKKELNKYLNIQKGFYYCTAECIIKTESASHPIKKTDLLQKIKEQLTVVKNNTDTVSNVITEAFPSYVMNQPNKLLILIPYSDTVSSYKIGINGAPFNIEDCKLNLSSEILKSFPLIKL
jgi:hypothetical protein